MLHCCIAALLGPAAFLRWHRSTGGARLASGGTDDAGGGGDASRAQLWSRLGPLGATGTEKSARTATALRDRDQSAKKPAAGRHPRAAGHYQRRLAPAEGSTVKQ